MRTAILLIIATFIFVGCKQNTNKEVEIDKIDTSTTSKKTIQKPTRNVANETIEIEQLNQLIPIDTIDSKSKDVYKKYGLDLGGNCYSCDLAELIITKKTIKLINVCDENLYQFFDIIELENIDNVIEIKTNTNNFIFTEIDKAPIYQLEITGNEINANNLRLSKYYTLKKILKKFKQHDCGDFQG